MTARLRRWFALALAPIAAAALIVVPAMPAGAAPKEPSGVDEDGGDTLLRDVLDSAGRRLVDAQAALRKSEKRQLTLILQVEQAEARREALLPYVGKVAAESYRTGKLTGLGLLLRSADTGSFLDRATALNEVNLLNAQRIKSYSDALADVAAKKQILDQEVKEERKQTAAIAAVKRDANKALALVGGAGLTQGYVTASSPEAKAAPRTSDGGWPREGCTRPDPTVSGGCLTPRTLHMYKQVRKAGFDRFVGCYRSGGPYEHPKGRACDWSLKNRGFAHAGPNDKDMRRYGNNLMAFLVRNAEALGVLYVIWYRKIWFPTTGWKPYHGASPHTDHVHVSML